MQLIAQAPPKTQPTLFEEPDTWLSSPLLAYSSLLSSLSLRATSKQVYITMFGRFIQFLTELGKDLRTCEQSDVIAFLETPNPNLPDGRKFSTARNRKAYLLLLERVYRKLAILGIRKDSPIDRIDRYYFGNNRPTRFLSPAEQSALLSLVKSRLEKLRQEKIDLSEINKNDNEFEVYWTSVRNLALICVLLGGGLKVGEVRVCAINCMAPDGSYIELSWRGVAHRPRILPFAIPYLDFWRSLAVQIAPGNDKLFLARKSGFGKLSRNTTPSHETIHRIVREFMIAANIPKERACAQTLRNTYAATLIANGLSNPELAICLGIKNDSSLNRLRASVKLHCEKITGTEYCDQVQTT